MAEGNVFMRARDLRASFVDYFRTARHEAMDAASIVPHGDDSLLFTNAGMVRFKDVLSGAVKPECSRAVTVQPCIRAGGKHNDLDEVGYTTRHHTFFEMLGNFSFGDYFKADAIELAWKLLVHEWGVDKKRLFVTVHEKDEESHELWKKIASLPENRIHIISSDDNFWSMGEVGPCGYCTEIFYDYETGDGAIDANGVSGNRFVEIWNLVFMQYEMMRDGSTRDLERHGVDTGMGLERIATVMQGKRENYDTDELCAIMNHISERSKNWNKVSSLFAVDEGVALRVMTDHLRATCALLAAGVMPTREGRGYVLRRIMRRAMRYAHGIGANGEDGANGAVLHECLPFVAKVMASSLPQTYDIKAMANCMREEEEQFAVTLKRGLSLLQDQLALLPKDNLLLSGTVAFTLYDTYGFPLEVTRDVMRRLHGTVDEEGYQKCMAEQSKRSRANREDYAGIASWAANFPKTEFLGYDKLGCEATVLGIKEREDKSIAVVLDTTVFYGEKGGQNGDSGEIVNEKGDLLCVVQDTQNMDDVIVHIGKMGTDPLKRGMRVKVRVYEFFRRGLSQHHTATHLLHEALRRVLGDHVEQRGSRVAYNGLRFDFSHSKPLSVDEIKAIGQDVTEQISCGHEVITQEMPIDEARQLGARMLFSEKYGDVVRVVSMGDYSVELCGGTHVRHTGECDFFLLTAQRGVAAGVRRIEAMVGQVAREYKITREAQERVRKKKVKEGGIGNKLLYDFDKNQGITQGRIIGQWYWHHQELDGKSIAELRSWADYWKEGQKTPTIITVVSQYEGRGYLVVTKTDGVSLPAVQFIKEAVSLFDGSGGGRDDFAQGGIPDGRKIQDLENEMYKLITHYEAR